ncbi:MAG: hypothetical protein LBQ40_01255 [Clostridiales bacterium]|jgi:hypothetical protein|nr:hypothetical protein [Clostridiales bacterium]
MKKSLKAVIVAALTTAVAVGALSALLIPGLDRLDYRHTNSQYPEVFRGNVADGALVTDIAMLAAHDAFSSGIARNSPPNKHDPSHIVNQLGALTDWGATNVIAGGFIERVSVAQTTGALDLAYSGVRYFDVRATYIDGEWYACHGLLSLPLREYIDDLILFLSERQGEFIVLEFRHVYYSSGAEELALLLNDIFFDAECNGETLIDYVRYDVSSTPLSELTYGDVTLGGAKSGAVVIFPESSQAAIAACGGRAVSAAYGCPGDADPLEKRDGELDESLPPVSYTVCYGYWHNRASSRAVIEGIRSETKKINADKEKYRGVFRINQAQQTPVFLLDELLPSLFGWSLIGMAETHNADLAASPDFDEWLSAMPVIQVDFVRADNGFLEKAMQSIRAYNAAL